MKKLRLIIPMFWLLLYFQGIHSQINVLDFLDGLSQESSDTAKVAASSHYSVTTFYVYVDPNSMDDVLWIRDTVKSGKAIKIK